MISKRIATPLILTAAIVFGAMFGILQQTRSVDARMMGQPPPTPTPTPTPCEDAGPEAICVAPSDTDGIVSADDCDNRPTTGAIGCDNLWPNGDHSDGNNNLHYLYLPPALTDTGKLLILLGGGDGNSKGITTVLGPVAAAQGYHVIGLTYPSAPANTCGNLNNEQNALNCFGDAFHEVVTGEERSPSHGGDKTSVGQHSQDSIVTRLLSVLQWADDNYPDDGWGKYLANNNTAVNWSEIHIGGHSNGSSHSSYMGSLSRFQDIGRVSLFAGPDDGIGGEDEASWNSATYIEEAADTATRYYGLVHYLNKARSLTTGEELDDPPAFQVYKNWNTFGMEGPYNQARFWFYPEPGETPDFGNAHMLISLDPEREVATNMAPWGTTKGESHNSVIEDVYCREEDVVDEIPGDDDDYDCNAFGNQRIGYEAAWRCILGSGDRYASERPISNAGPNQTVECEGGGGTTVQLDGSASTDVDCDVLKYAWAGPFGLETGRNPSVFCPVGFNFIALVASDDWWASLVPSTTLVNVVDTTPPSLTVTLSPTTLWPADHRLIRIDAAVTASDSCGAAPVQVVLTSITNSQADNGLGDGDTDRDIQEAAYGTFDTSFLLRAERAGNVTAGRTYTVTYTATDASENSTPVSATIHVPHEQ